MRLMPGRLALPPQQDEQPAIAEPAALIGQLAQPGAQLRVRRPARAVADHLPIRADDRTGPPLRQAHHGLQMRDRVALGGGPYHFFDRSSRSAAASSICSASSFFSFAFSSSSAFSRLASETSMPPNLAFQLVGMDCSPSSAVTLRLEHEMKESPMTVHMLGVDLAKNIFQLHGVDRKGKAVFGKRLRRDQLMPFIAKLPACLIGIEACTGAFFWQRQFELHGHTVKIMPPR